MAENGSRLSWSPPLSARSVASSTPGFAAPSVASSTYAGIYLAEEMLSKIQQMNAKQTRELQASFREEAQKQRAMMQQLVAETQQLRGRVEQLEGYLSAKGAAEEGPSAEGGAEEQGGLEGQQDGRRETVHLDPDRALPEDGALEPGGWPAPSGRLEEHLSPDRPEAARDVKVTNNARAHVKLWLDSLSRMLGGKDGPRGMSTNDPDFSGSGWCRVQCKKMTKSGWCRALVQGMIVADGVFLGFEANAIMTSSDFSMPDSVKWRVATACFASAFQVELAIRCVADGCEFLRPRNEEFMWNLFDTLLTLSIFANEALYVFSIQRVALLRVAHITGLHIRLLRVTHITRAFPVFRRELKELNMMITGLLRCVRPLFWAGVLLFALTYMMGIIVSQLIAEYFHSCRHEHLDERVLRSTIADADDDDRFFTDLEPEFLRYITKHFPDLWWSMYSLFEALTGGRDWGEIAGPFIHVNRVLGVFLVLYIFVGIFCILNLLTAVFLDAAQRVDTADHVYAKKDWVKETREFISKAIEHIPPAHMPAGTGNGTETKRLTKEGFFWLVEQPENQAYLKDYGLDLFLTDEKRLEELFEIMDVDGSGNVDVDEFVSALYDLKGTASSMDLQRALHMIRSLIRSLQTQTDESPRRSSSIHTVLSL